MFKKNIHFIGIGGIGISALARILHDQGYNISGSDAKQSSLTDLIEGEGIKIYIGHAEANLQPEVEQIIYTKAIPIDNLELQAAKKRGLDLQSYPQALGLFSADKLSIAITGTHGKTTCTGMNALALIENKLDPTVLIGSTISNFQNKNYRIGKSNYFLFEACEYQRSFLNYHPDIAIINNIELDHLDYFTDLNDYLEAFDQFIAQVKTNGTLIINGDDINIKRLNFKNHKVIKYGLSDQNNLILKKDHVYFNNQQIGRLELAVLGEFNKINALSAIALTLALNLDASTTFQALKLYQGSSRRLEYLGKYANLEVFDDYAHHPTAIKLTSEGLKNKFQHQKKILCVFQPHQYSRTAELLSDFGKCFEFCDRVIIPNIYEARDSEEDKRAVSTDILVAEINKNIPNKSENGFNFEQTKQRIEALKDQYDILLFMGAGDITNLARQFKISSK